MSTVLDPDSPVHPAAYDSTVAYDQAEVAAAAGQPPTVGPPPPSPGDHSSGRRVLAVLAAVGVVLVLLGAAAVVLTHRSADSLSTQAASARLGGLGSKATGVNADQLAQDGTPPDQGADQGGAPATTTPPTTAPQPPATVTVVVPGGGGQSGAGSGQGSTGQGTDNGTTTDPGKGNGSTGNPNGNGNTGTTTPPKPAPQLVSFSIPSQVDCSNPANQTPYIPVSWTTKNATEVTLAIDGPGIYKSYPGANGSDTVPFACAGPHTYTIVAKGPGGMTTKQVKVTAKPKVIILPDNPKAPKLPGNINVDPNS